MEQDEMRRLSMMKKNWMQCFLQIRLLDKSLKFIAFSI